MTTGLNVPDKGRWDAEAVPWTRLCTSCVDWDVQKGCRRYKLPTRCASARIPPPGEERRALIHRVGNRIMQKYGHPGALGACSWIACEQQIEDFLEALGKEATP